MRVSPWLIGCLLCCSTVVHASDWVSVEKAMTQSTSSKQPAVTYDPSHSVAEFNRRQAAREPAAHLLVAVEIPRDQLNLRKITNRPVRFVASDATFQGKVTAAFLESSDSDKVILHARIDNRLNAAEKWILKPGTTGTLSILP